MELFFSGSQILYDPLWEGPLKKKRYCTNRSWSIAFISFFIIWMIIAIHAFSNGNIQKVIVPTDSNGRKCGIDASVIDKPYLVFFDLTKCINGKCDTPQVCQSHCPNENFLYEKFMQNNSTLAEVKKKILCQIDINVDLITNWDQLDFYTEINKCTKWYLKSEPVIKRCIPKAPIPTDFNTTISLDQLNNATQLILQLSKLEKTLEDIYRDIITVGYPVLGFIALSGIAAFFYIILLKWLAKPFVYATIFIICTILVYFIYQSSLQYSIKNSSDWLYILVLCIILLIVVVISTILLHEKIYLACQIINESSKAVTCIWSSLLFPILPWIFHTIIFALSVAVFLYLHTISVPKYQVRVQEMVKNTCICPTQLKYINNATCDQDIFLKECKDINGGSCLSSGCYLTTTTAPGQIYIYHLINIVAFVWMSFYISAAGQMALALAFATWYWTFNKKNVPRLTLFKSLWITLRYHTGTLAFGSLIIWFCNIIRIILRPFAGNVQSNSAMNVQPVGCLKPLIDIAVNFLKYTTGDAYIMCAIHGKGFCKSAKDAFNLVIRNVIRVIVVNNIADWLLRIAKYFIIILTVTLTLEYYSNKIPEVINDVKVPVVMTFIGSYLITTIFFTVHKTAVDTLFLCYLEDSERNNGSHDRPYYMSMKLRQLLKK